MRIDDQQRLEKLMETYGVVEMFGQDMTPEISLYHFKRNEFICREGEEIEQLYIFLYGKAKVTSNLSSGKSLLLDFYRDTMLLGELEFLKEKDAASSVQAIEDCYCLGIPMSIAREKLLSDSKFLLYVARSLGQKLERIAKNSSINLLYPLQNRLASYIMATGKRIDTEAGVKLMFKTNLSQTADLLGTSYRHLLRTMEEFRASGLLVKQGRTYVVGDISALERLAGDLYMD
jgi:CRP-like cAMP-binding protein